MKRSLLVTALFAGSLLLAPGLVHSQIAPTPKKEQINKSINRAIDFLSDRQYAFGSFPTDKCETVQMQECIKRPILFLAANILVSLNTLEDERVRRMKERAAKLFIEQQDRQGLWDFYVKKAQTPAYPHEVSEFTTYYFPDLDDTAVISYFLKTNGYTFRDNRTKINSNRERGLYLTFARETQPPPPHLGNIDPVVNAHTLMYLGTSDKKVCDFMNKAIASNEPSLYYQDRILYFYLIARAFHNGVRCLSESAGPITQYLQSQRRSDGSFGSPLQTAAALNTLTYFDRAKDLHPTVNKLLQEQQADGSWAPAFFFGGPVLGYGSAELTTAVAIEALNNYQKLAVR